MHRQLRFPLPGKTGYQLVLGINPTDFTLYPYLQIWDDSLEWTPNGNIARGWTDSSDMCDEGNWDEVHEAYVAHVAKMAGEGDCYFENVPTEVVKKWYESDGYLRDSIPHEIDVMVTTFVNALAKRLPKEVPMENESLVQTFE